MFHARPTTRTSDILQLTSPVHNQYQGPSKRLLFVCSVGMLRSPTAAKIAVLRGYNARSCGSDVQAALIPVSLNLLAWAAKVYFMQEYNYKQTKLVFQDSTEGLACIEQKKVLWNIDDEYDYDSEKLKEKINAVLA
jgi:predicted protein tyrosine phosphatase